MLPGTRQPLNYTYLLQKVQGEDFDADNVGAKPHSTG